MKRFSILGTQYGSKTETEICQIETNPEQARDAVAAMILHGPKRLQVFKYDNVRIVENHK